MSATRKISWTAAMHELAADRTKRTQVCEFPIHRGGRVAGGLPALTAWRGLSAARYIARIFPLSAFGGAEIGAEPFPVMLAVRRELGGHGTPIAARALGDIDADRGWLTACVQDYGANEIHIHTLMAKTPEQAAAIARDLSGPLPTRARSAA